MDKNVNTIFLSAVDEKQLIYIVQKSKNNYSMDCHFINMALLKNVFNSIGIFNDLKKGSRNLKGVG